MTIQPYGTWDSPITAELAASSGVQFQDLIIDGNDIYWSEMRSSEAGRIVILKYSSKKEIEECLSKDYSARTRVHEYGGAAFIVREGVLYFVNDKDQQLYCQRPNEKPQCLTKGAVRLADFRMTSTGMVAVAESHNDTENSPQNYLVLIDLKTGALSELATGHDFYASPAISPDGSKIAWIVWNHPNMPWDNTTLWMADFKDNKLENVVQIDSEYSEQSFFQPQWNEHNELFVVSDKSNWWNLYQVKGATLEPIISFNHEMGKPMWVFGLSTWAFYQQGIVVSHTLPTGGECLAYYTKNTVRVFDLPFTGFSNIRVCQEDIVCFAHSPDKPTALIKINKTGEYLVIHSSSQVVIDQADISVPVHIEFSSHDRLAYGYFYAPKNKDFQGPVSDKPPLMVLCHGGPTGQTSNEWNVGVQYWTSRGWAVVDVNYAGSTGYGRAFRKSLEGNWGVFEVEDCQAAVRYLIDKGWVDAKKVVMSGGSAGGLTVLSALAHSDLFSAGCVRYGVTDLKSLVHDTHKFESHYLDRLIGPYPEQQAKYEERSPVNFSDKIHSPVIFFHGDEDKVVPLSQTQAMVQILRSKGLVCECIIFEKEQHGFRQAESRIKVLEEKLKFLLKVLYT